MSFLHLRGVTVTGSAGRLLLDDVDLEVPDGSALAVIGPSAESKSTLLRTLVGLVAPAAGEIVIDDEVVTASDPRERNLAMVFADHALHPHLDVLDNLAFAATLRRGFDQVDLADTIDEVAADLALSDVLDLKPSALGLPQQQRVAIGRSIVRDANAYLFDDAFSAQSERIRPHVRSVVQQWQADRARTSIFTTGVVSEALTLADRVAVLHQGRVRQVGSPRDLYERPQDMFVAGYLGSPPMNLLPAFPAGEQLVTPLMTMYLDEELQERIGERNVVILGIRPEHCRDATRGPVEVSDRVEFTTRVDDVEWRGSSQYAYLGFEIDPELAEVLEEVEEIFEFDLFQPFLVAEVSPETSLSPGMSIHVVIPRPKVCVFDPLTGENLSLPRD